MLEAIVARVRRDLPALLAREPELRAALASAPPVRDFVAGLVGPRLAVIAEVKRRSPSRGVIDADLDPVAQAVKYVAGGAGAISVLTERHHFDGSLQDLAAVRAGVECPVLRKDFIVEPIQVLEARAGGADAVLLIAAVLDDATLGRLLAEVSGYGMVALVEAHDEQEAERAVAAGAQVVGVNNRDLSTFEVDLSTAERVAGALDGATVRVAESGIWTGSDAARMREAGYDAVLVGEALVRSADPAGLLRQMRQAT